jgi:hypothetical protein
MMKLKCLLLTFLVVLTPTLFAQPSMQYSHGEPTDLEQYMLELINRARANPTQEGIFLDTLDTDYARRSRERKPEFFVNLRQEFASYLSAQPVALNMQLIQAARLHSQDMINQNYMGHYSPEGTSPSDRIEAQGYSNYTGENVSSSGASTAEEMVDEHFGFMVDHDNAMHDTHPFGHRLNVLSTTHSEVGIGNVVIGNSSRITQDFGRTPARIFLLGVVYQDQNGNNFYDPGEGLSDVTVMPSEGDYFAVTSASGGYAIPFDATETRDAGQASTVLSPNSSWSNDVKPVADRFVQDYRSNPANQPSMTLSLTASGSGLSAPFTQTVTMVKPITVTYRINQTDNVYWPQEFVLGSNVKVDFNIAQPHDTTPPIDNTPDPIEDTTTPPVIDTTDSSELVWHTSKTEALAQAQSENKLLLVFAGRMTCGNCQKMRYTVLESTAPAIKQLLQEHFVLWFSDIDENQEWSIYATGLDSFSTPLIAIVNPNDSENYLERTTGVQTAETMYALLENSVETTSVTIPVVNTSVFAPFAGKTWILTNEKGSDEISFNVTPENNILLGLDTSSREWLVTYDDAYWVMRVEAIGGNTSGFIYQLYCDSNCANMTGQYVIVYAIDTTAETAEGPYSASGHIKSVTTVSDNDTLPITVSEVPEPASWQTQIDYYRDTTTGDIWRDTPAWQLSLSGELPQDIWKYGLRAIYLAKYACQSAEIREWMPINIANGIYYCTNPANKQQTINYLITLADKLQGESTTRSSNLRAQSPVLDSDPKSGEVPINYYRNETTGDVWGSEPAYRLPVASGYLPDDLWKYGLRALYLAKYACQSEDVREWMPTNIANGIYYCTNPEDRAQTINYLLALAEKLATEQDSCLRVKRPNSPEEQLFDSDFIDFSPTTAVK